MLAVKRKLCLIFAMLILFAFSGCGVKKIVVSSVTSGAVGQREAESFRISVSAGETLRMSNYMLSGRFVHEKKLLYGSRHDESGQPMLCRMKYTAGQNGMYVRESETIDTGVDAQYLALDGNWLYYLRDEAGEICICRIPSAFGASVEKEVLYDSSCDFLFLKNERLYFTDAEHHLLSMREDGSDLKKELSDKEIYYPYLLTDDLLLYQDDADGESLRMRYLPTGFEIRVSRGRVFSFIVQGSELWFLRADSGEGEKCRLCRVDLNEFLSGFNPNERPDAAFSFTVEEADGFMGPVFSINGDHINASNYQTVALGGWKTLSDDAWQKGFVAACQYVTGDYEIFYDYNGEGFVKSMLFYEPELKRTSYIEIHR